MSFERKLVNGTDIRSLNEKDTVYMLQNLEGILLGKDCAVARLRNCEKRKKEKKQISLI